MRANKNLRILLTLVVIAAFVLYFVFNADKFKPLTHINALFLLLIALGDITSIFINGLFTKFILRPFNKSIPMLESFYVSLISSVGNFFAPVGAGFGFRAIYLKQKFKVPYTEYIATLAGNYIIVFLSNSFFGLLSLYLLRSHKNSQYSLLVLVFAGIFATSLTLSLVKIPLGFAQKQRFKFLRTFLDHLAIVTKGWNHIISHKKLMLQLIGLSALSLPLTMGITWTIIHSLHFSISLAPLILFSVLGSLSLFINITPANLGVKEAIYLFSSHVLGFSVSQILSIALVDRGVMFVLLFVLWIGARSLKRGELRPKTTGA